MVNGVGANGCSFYESEAAPANGMINIPLAQFAFTGLGGAAVRGEMILLSPDQVRWPFEFCCGCGCIEVVNPAPPLACNIPIDFNVADPQFFTSGDLTQAGFVPFLVNPSTPIGSRLDDSNSGLQFEVIGGRLGFNNAWDNTFPETPNKLLIDGIQDDFDADYVGVSVYQLQRGTYRVSLWVYDQQVPDLPTHQAYWDTYDPSVLGDPSNNPSGPIFGPFAPQPVGPPGSPLLDDPGAPAATFEVFADGTSYYQLLVVNAECPRQNCQTRLNGFQLELMDETPPVLECQDVFITTDQCTTQANWCEPSTISDNCPLPNAVAGLTPVQTAGPSKGSVLDVGCYQVQYTAQDTSGNMGTCEFNVFVTDESAPSLAACVPDFSVPNTPGLCSARPTWADPDANVACSTALTYTYSPFSSGDAIPVGVTEIMLNVSDCLGRFDTCSFTVEVVDVEPPVLCSPPLDVTMPCGPLYREWLNSGGFAQWDDNCGIDTEPIYDEMFCGAQPVVTGPVTWTANVSGQSVIIGPAKFVTADASCVCENIAASAIVDASIVACDGGDFPFTRNATITVVEPQSAIGPSTTTFRYVYNLPGAAPLETRTNSSIFEVALAPGRWSFVIYAENRHLVTTLCLNIPFCGSGASEIFLVTNSASGASVLHRFDQPSGVIEAVGPVMLQITRKRNRDVEVSAIAFHPDGRLFGAVGPNSGNNPNSLVEIDPSTAIVTTVVGAFGVEIRDLTIRTNGTMAELFGVGPNAETALLYKIDLTTGAATLVSSQSKLNGTSSVAIGLGTSSDGNLWITSASLVPQWFTVANNDAALEVGIPVAPTPSLDTTGGVFYGPLAFDQKDNFYAIRRNSAADDSTTTTEVYTLDRVTGKSSSTVVPAVAGISGLAIRFE